MGTFARVRRGREVSATAVKDGLVQLFNRAVPFGGVGQSGIGSRHGRAGITKYTEPHTIMTSCLPLK